MTTYYVATLASYVLVEAVRFGVPRSVLVRMLLNIGLDTALGAVPGLAGPVQVHIEDAQYGGVHGGDHTPVGVSQFSVRMLGRAAKSRSVVRSVRFMVRHMAASIMSTCDSTRPRARSSWRIAA